MGTAAAREIDGRVERDGASLAVRVVGAHPTTLIAAFASGQAPPDGAVLTRLVLKVGDQTVELGRCSFEPHSARPPGRRASDSAPDPGDGRLVFLDRVFDFTGLFTRGVVTELRQRVEQLPLIWSRKEAIVPAFREHAADVLYDMQVYRAIFDELDAKLGCESQRTRAKIQEQVRVQEYPRFYRFFDENPPLGWK